MRLLPAVVLGYLALVVTGGEAQAYATATLGAGLTRPALLEIDRALGFGLAAEATPFDAALDTPRRVVTPAGRVIFLPNGCRTAAEPWDLLVHFHGAPTAVEPAFERSGVDAVLAILNLGIGSGAYESAFQSPGTLEELVARVAGSVRDLCPGAAPAPHRIALSGWSAGYGAVQRMLGRPKDAARVDAVLLADGLHASLELGSPRERRVSADQMGPFAAFADEAMLGRKLFALTHSAIQTPYASTTETADYLLGQEDIERAPGGATVKPGMVPTSHASAGGFHVLGFAGGNERAHADHLHAFGETLMPYLKQRWSTPR